jgi:hypothetical protein
LRQAREKRFGYGKVLGDVLIDGQTRFEITSCGKYRRSGVHKRLGNESAVAKIAFEPLYFSWEANDTASAYQSGNVMTLP